MRSAAEAKVGWVNAAIASGSLSPKQEAVELDLWTVATAFLEAQRRRHLADYDLEKAWAPDEVNSHIEQIDEAFSVWTKAAEEETAQAFLVSLFGAREKRAGEPKAAPRKPAPNTRRKPPPA